MATTQTNGHASSSTMSPEPRDSFLNGSSANGSQYGGENGYHRASFQAQTDAIVNHLYHTGFQNGNYADTVLHVFQHTYGLHAIILSRSPFLAHLMSTAPTTGGQRVVYVPLDHEPEVTQEGFAIALGYLYSPVSLNLIRPENARGVLAAGCLLGGMHELCEHAYEACRQSITQTSVHEWLEFVESVSYTSPQNGSGSPQVNVQSITSTTSVFGPYAQRLRDDVLEYLVVTLPAALNILQRGPANGTVSPSPEPHSPSSQHGSGRDTLLDIFSRVPFDLFKAAVESPAFQIGSDQARFKFAKDAIEVRKKAGISRGTGAEETVVLAFGGGNGTVGGSAVHITRKLRKKPLWKINA